MISVITRAIIANIEGGIFLLFAVLAGDFFFLPLATGLDGGEATAFEIFFFLLAIRNSMIYHAQQMYVFNIILMCI